MINCFKFYKYNRKDQQDPHRSGAQQNLAQIEAIVLVYLANNTVNCEEASRIVFHIEEDGTRRVFLLIVDDTANCPSFKDEQQ